MEKPKIVDMFRLSRHLLKFFLEGGNNGVIPQTTTKQVKIHTTTIRTVTTRNRVLLQFIMVDHIIMTKMRQQCTLQEQTLTGTNTISMATVIVMAMTIILNIRVTTIIIRRFTMFNSL